MSREAWGDPPDPEPQRCPVCDGEWHAEGCELGEEVSRRLKAESELARLKGALKDSQERCAEWASIAGAHGAEVDRLRGLLNDRHAQIQSQQPETQPGAPRFDGADAWNAYEGKA